MRLRKDFTAEELERAIALHLAGESVRAIALQFGVGERRVRHALRRAGYLGKPGRPRQHESDAARSKAYRERRKVQDPLSNA